MFSPRTFISVLAGLAVLSGCQTTTNGSQSFGYDSATLSFSLRGFDDDYTCTPIGVAGDDIKFKEKPTEPELTIFGYATQSNGGSVVCSVSGRSATSSGRSIVTRAFTRIPAGTVNAEFIIDAGGFVEMVATLRDGKVVTREFQDFSGNK